MEFSKMQNSRIINNFALNALFQCLFFLLKGVKPISYQNECNFLHKCVQSSQFSSNEKTISCFIHSFIKSIFLVCLMA